MGAVEINSTMSHTETDHVQDHADMRRRKRRKKKPYTQHASSMTSSSHSDESLVYERLVFARQSLASPGCSCVADIELPFVRYGITLIIPSFSITATLSN